MLRPPEKNSQPLVGKSLAGREKGKDKTEKESGGRERPSVVSTSGSAGRRLRATDGREQGRRSRSRVCEKSKRGRQTALGERGVQRVRERVIDGASEAGEPIPANGSLRIGPNPSPPPRFVIDLLMWRCAS